MRYVVKQSQDRRVRMTTVTYDHMTDTLYVNYDIRRPVTNSTEEPAGVIRRYDGDNLVGVTVLDFTNRLMGGDAVLGGSR